MMAIEIEQNQIDYIGAFAAPAFPLWGEGRSLLEGLYEAFSAFNLSLADFRIEGSSDDPSSQSVRVSLAGTATFRFRFDRIEFALTNFDPSELDRFFGALTRTAEWLKSTLPGFRFRSHLIGYAAHATTPGQSSSEFLQTLRVPELRALGDGRGSGIIFHGEYPNADRREQFTLDHSLVVNGGLFLNLVSVSESDQMDYAVEAKRLTAVFGEALNELGLFLKEN